MATLGTHPARPVTRIEPSRAVIRLGLREMWAYRELLYFLTLRDVKVRYKQTAFGLAWAIGQPLLLMAIFSVFLGRLARVPSDGLPYPLFVFAGLLPWTMFAQVLQGASESLVRSSDLITKIYFPRVFMPLGVAASFVVDFIASLAVLGVMSLLYHTKLTAAVLLLPVLLVLALFTAFSVGIWLAALNVRYRDVRHAVPFLIQAWLFATPVVYPLSIVPDRWHIVYAFNPMVGVVEGFRWALLGSGPAPGLALAVSAAAALAICMMGLAFFQRVERTFADVI